MDPVENRILLLMTRRQAGLAYLQRDSSQRTNGPGSLASQRLAPTLTGFGVIAVRGAVKIALLQSSETRPALALAHPPVCTRDAQTDLSRLLQGLPALIAAVQSPTTYATHLW